MIALLVAACGTPTTPAAPSDVVDWVHLQGGTFSMGSAEPDGNKDEWPQHEVTLPDFDLGRTEITVQQYRKCVDAGACAPLPTDANCYFQRKGHLKFAANCMNWEQARTFCSFAGGHLPTEAQWEYAARGRGRDVQYPWGDEAPDCSRAVMDDERSGGRACGKHTSQPPCTKPAGNTPDGLCDMAGNVFEWVEDWYVDTYQGASAAGTPPDHASPGDYRVLRGGGVGSKVPVRARLRTFHKPDFSYGGMGARCARG